MLRPVQAAARLVLLGLAALVASSAAAVESPLDLPPLTADPAELLKLADSRPKPEKADVDFLLDETTVIFDEQGRRTTTARLIFRTFTAEAVETFGQMRWEWSPWFEERPVLEARVIGKDGVVRLLDPKTVADSVTDDESTVEYTDTRVVRAPLPAVEPGAVVERVITVREERAPFEAGVAASLPIDTRLPTRKVRLVLDAPRSLPLRYALRGTKVAPKRTDTARRTRIVVEVDDAPAPPEAEPFAPREASPFPALRYSTGRSWKAMAAFYARAVDRQRAIGDLGPLVEQTVGSATAPEEVVARLLAFIRREIRYTGIEFGESGVVPHTPEETLARKYGDCKDMATLLVAMLARAGISASVALLNTSWQELEADLPGLGLFNHAIVYVPGAHPLWIDPTNASAAVGHLPIPDQGRQALIASPASQALVRTPASSPADSRLKITREVTLAEEGQGRVVEVREATGTMGTVLRDQFPADPEARAKRLEAEAKEIFGSPEVRVRKTSGFADVRDPVKVEVEAQQTVRARTDREKAVVAVANTAVLRFLPWFVWNTPKKDAPADGEEPPAKEKKRESTLVLPYAFSAELEYRLVPPPGFVPRPLPKSSTVRVGPASLSQSFAAGPDGTVTYRVAFDTGSGRFTAAQTEELIAAVRGAGPEKFSLVEFEDQASSLVAAGRYREALAERQRLVALHPLEALHRERLAEALLEAGLGEAARVQARKAVELEPKRAKAQMALAGALMRDPIGRVVEKGFDRPGALAALRAAKELEPKNFEARAKLAWLLELDDRAIRYAPGASLDEAIVEYRAMHDLNPKDEDPFLFCLLRAGKIADLRQVARAAKPTSARNSLLVAAVAALDGVPAGLQEAAGVEPSGEAQARLLMSASRWLAQMRRYGDAAGLLRQASSRGPSAAEVENMIAVFDKMRVFDPAKLNDKLPADLVRRALWAPYSTTASEAEYARLFAKSLSSGEPLALEKLREQRQRKAMSEGLPLAFDLDLELVASAAVEGEAATGWRVQLSNPLGDRVSDTWFALDEGGLPRLVPVDLSPSIVALQQGLKGRAAAARQWLRWSQGTEPVKTCAGESDSQTVLREAARGAALYAGWGHHTPAEAAPVLEEALACAQEGRRQAVASALAGALVEEKPERVLELADRGLLDAADSAHFRQRAWSKLGRTAQSRRFFEELLLQQPDDESAQVALFEIARETDDAPSLERIGRKLVKQGKAKYSEVYNDLAWVSLFHGPVTEQAVDDARKAASLASYYPRNKLHTLAALYAEVGRPAEAVQTLRKSLDSVKGAEVREEDWYVVGRIAEECGMPEEARRAYQRLAAPKTPGPHATYELARRRLSALGRPR